jgi:hypothetical protein
MKRLLLGIGLLALAGCGSATEWSRANTSPEQLARDEKECRAVGDQKAFDASFKPRSYGFGAGMTTESPSYFERGADMYLFTNECMMQRGYRLVPVPAPGQPKTS